jgi:hypothetical protein
VLVLAQGEDEPAGEAGCAARRELEHVQTVYSTPVPPRPRRRVAAAPGRAAKARKAPAPWLFASATLLRRTGTATELCGCLRGLLLGSSSPPGGPPGPWTPRRGGPVRSAG